MSVNTTTYLKGPLTLEQAQVHTPDLWSQLRNTLPRGVTRLSAYLDHHNRWGVQFWQRQGLELAKTSLVFEWAARSLSPAPASSYRVVALDRNTTSSLASLHQAAFPMATLDAAALLADGSSERALLALEPSGTPVGYVIYSWQDAQSAQVSYMAVRPQSRRLGIGRQLLTAALGDLAEQGTERVLLSVDEVNANARSLYEALGFTLEFTGVALSGNLAR